MIGLQPLFLEINLAQIKNLQQCVGFASRLHPLRADVLDIGFFRAPQLLLPRRHRTGREAEGIAPGRGYSTQDAPDEESKRGQRDEDRSEIKKLGFYEGFRGLLGTGWGRGRGRGRGKLRSVANGAGMLGVLGGGLSHGRRFVL
ncbi:hypothetical protein BHM03_00016875 [Ensete ventricosum]|nr:hypothetical protein BHM03_00016875 [Ensete ventricosum]